MTSPDSPAGQRWPQALTQAQADRLLTLQGFASVILPGRPDLPCPVLIHCRIGSEISPLQDSSDCLSPAAAQKSLVRTPQRGVQEQSGVGAPPRRRGRGAGRRDTAPPAGDGVRGGGAWPGTGPGEGAARGSPHPPFSHRPHSAELRRSPLPRESAAQSAPHPEQFFFLELSLRR